MHQYRHIELTSHQPQRVETGIIDGHQLVVLVAHMQSKRFPDFEAFGTTGNLSLQAFSSPKPKFIAATDPLRPINSGKHPEALGGALDK